MSASLRMASLRAKVAGGAVLLTGVGIAAAIAGGAVATAATTGSCSATGRIDSQWGAGSTGGEIVTVTVLNTATTTSTTWTVTFTLASGTQMVSAWNAVATTAGSAVTAGNPSYNGTLAPGASTTFGMQLAGTGPLPVFNCGNDAPGPTPSSSGTASSSSSTGADVTIGPGDSSRTVTLIVGQTLGVSLPANFDPTRTSGTGLTLLSSSGGFPTGQPFAALYRATAAGRVDLSSTTDFACLHTNPPTCLTPQALWLVHLNIVDAGTGQTVTVNDSNNAGSVSLRVGDTLAVNLVSIYTPPTLSASGVLVQRDSSGGYPTTQPLVVHLQAVAPGQVDVSSFTDAACLHAATPCPSPQIPWRVHVTVTS